MFVHEEKQPKLTPDSTSRHVGSPSVHSMIVFSANWYVQRKVYGSQADEQNLSKNIPGSPEGQAQVHEKKSPIFTRVQK